MPRQYQIQCPICSRYIQGPDYSAGCGLCLCECCGQLFMISFKKTQRCDVCEVRVDCLKFSRKELF